MLTNRARRNRYGVELIINASASNWVFVLPYWASTGHRHCVKCPNIVDTRASNWVFVLPCWASTGHRHCVKCPNIVNASAGNWIFVLPCWASTGHRYGVKRRAAGNGIISRTARQNIVNFFAFTGERVSNLSGEASGCTRGGHRVQDRGIPANRASSA